MRKQILIPKLISKSLMIVQRQFYDQKFKMIATAMTFFPWKCTVCYGSLGRWGCQLAHNAFTSREGPNPTSPASYRTRKENKNIKQTITTTQHTTRRTLRQLLVSSSPPNLVVAASAIQFPTTQNSPLTYPSSPYYFQNR